MVRTLAERHLEGENLRSLAVWLNAEGVPTLGGGPWKTQVIGTMLRSPRIAGLREHRGEVVGPAIWEPIISEETRNRILAAKEARKTSGRRTPRRYLLSGLLRCSKCGGTLFANARDDVRRYICGSGPTRRCGRITITALPVEQLLADAVLYRLDTPELSDALAGKTKRTVDTDDLADQLAADRNQLDELAAAYGSGTGFTMREWLAARKPIEERIGLTERKLRQAMNTGSLAAYIGQGQALADSGARSTSPVRPPSCRPYSIMP